MNQPAAPNNRAMSRTRETLQHLVDQLEQQRAQITAYLPPDVAPERFMALARRAILDQPDLADCSASSVLRALSACAASGLPLDGRHSSLIVRKSKQGRPTAHWDPTYRGMTTLALSSGHVLDVQAFVVREGDEFTVEQGTEPRIHHRPSLADGAGRVVASYAFARLRAGGMVIELLGRADIDRIRAMSPAGERGPWGQWEDEMARKSAVRRLLKRLPSAPATHPALPIPAQPLTAAPAVTHTPDAFGLECGALERLSDADSLTELAAAWGQIGLAYAQARLEMPARVEELHHERREALQQGERAKQAGSGAGDTDGDIGSF